MHKQKLYTPLNDVDIWLSENVLSGTYDDYNSATIRDEILPDLKLRWSMLTRAILDVLGRPVDIDDDPKVVKDQALQWMTQGDEGTLSFNDVCGDLNLDPMRVLTTVTSAMNQGWKINTQKPFEDFILNLLSL